MSSLFLDTSGLLCLHDMRDQRQPLARKSYRAARHVVTTNYVLAEFVALAHVRGVSRANVLKILNDLAAVPRVEIHGVSKTLHQ